MVQASVFQKTIKKTSADVVQSQQEVYDVESMLSDDQTYMGKTLANYKKIVSILSKTTTLAAQHFDL